MANQNLELALRITADAKQSVGAFLESKKRLVDLEKAAQEATLAVATAARALKASPDDKKLQKTFDDAKKSASAAKAEFLKVRDATNQMRQSLAGMGINSTRLNADLKALKAPLPDTTKPLKKGITETSNQAAGLKRALIGIVTAVAGIQGLTKLGQMADAYKQFNAQIKLGIGDQGDMAMAQAEVGRIANENLVSLEAVGKLYGRMASPILRLGKSQLEVGKTTEAMALSLRISGATAQESASAILQFSQSMASGVLRGEEFNSVNEAAPRLMLALAESLNVPRESLRGMAEQGLLTSELLATALPKALGKLRAEAATLPTTVGGAFQVMKNQMLDAIGQADKAAGVSAKLGSVIIGIANNLSVLAGVVAGLLTAAFTGLAVSAAASIGGIAVKLRVLLALIGGPVGLVVSLAAAALAWFGFRKSATAELDAVIAKQKELNDLTGKGLSKKDAADPRKVSLATNQEQLQTKRDELAKLEKFIASPARLSGQSYGISEQRAAKLRDDIKVAEQSIARQQAEIAQSDAEDAAREGEIKRLLAEARANAGDKPTKDKTTKTTKADTGRPFDKDGFFSDQIAAGNAAADEELKALAEAQRLIDEKKQKQLDFIDGIEQEAYLTGLSNDERETSLLLLEAEKLGITDINRILELQGTIRKNNADKDAAEETQRQQDDLYQSVQGGVQRAFADGLNAVGTDGGFLGALQGLVGTIKNALSNALAGSLTDGFLGMLGGKEGVLGMAGAFGIGGKKDGSTPASAIYVSDVAAGADSLLGGEGEEGGMFGGLGSIFSNMFSGFGNMMSGLFSSLMSGLTSLMSGIGGGMSGMLSGIGSLFGFADGGYTGPGGKYQPAGVVHAGEWVNTAEEVNYFGLPFFNALRRMARGGAAPSMPRLSYADGGLVNLPGSAAPSVTSNTKIVNLFDIESAMSEYLNTRGGERSILNVIQRNPGAAGA